MNNKATCNLLDGGKTKIKLYGIEYEVKICISEENRDLTALQLDSFIHYKKNVRYLAKYIEQAIYDYYKSNKFEHEQKNILEKDITETIDLKELVTPIKLCIPQLNNDREIDIIFDCSWDDEMVMQVKIIDESVIKVGMQRSIL